jgi:hypothetical protein
MAEETYSGAVTDTATSTQGVSAIGQLGVRRREPDGRTYRCVKAADLLVVNRLVEWSSAKAWSVTATTVENGPKYAGLAISAIPANGFGWILVGGFGEAAPGEAITAGLPIRSLSTAGKVGEVTNTTAAEVSGIVGWCVDAATADVTPALITVYLYEKA